MSQYVFTMNRVAKIVPPKRFILRDISLSFFPGAKIGVLGLNGSGKSTLLRIMAGVDKEFEGEARPQPGIRIGFLPQEPDVDPSKTVRQIVEEGVAEIIGLVHRFNAIAERFAEPLDDNEMNKLLDEQARLQDTDRRQGRLGNRSQARNRRRRAAPARLAGAGAQSLGRRAPPRRAVPPAALGAGHAAARRADQPPRRPVRRLAGEIPGEVPGHRHRRHPRPVFPRQRGRLDPRARPRARHPVEGQLLVLAGAEGGPPGHRGKAGSGAPEDHQGRARMGARQPFGAAGQEQGAAAALRGAVLPGLPAPPGDQRDLHPARRAAGRPRDRGEPRCARASGTGC